MTTNNSWNLTNIRSRLSSKLSSVTESVNLDINNSNNKMLLTVVGTVITISITFGILFYNDIRKHKNSKKPLGYKKISKNESNYPNNIKDRTSKDIVKDRFTPPKTIIPKNADYIIIGSGIGGLSSAAFLSRVGKKCLVLEQHDRLGGCMHQYSRGYGFDVGIHYIGRPKKYTKWLRCITDPDCEQYPIKFVSCGDENDNYTYDKYIIGEGKNQVVFNAKQHGLMKGMKEDFTDPEDQEVLDKLEDCMKQSKIAMLLSIVSRITPLWMSKIIYYIGSIKYSDVWNKTIDQALDDIGCYKQNKLIAMNFTANLGDLGGFRKNNSFPLFCGLQAHFSEGGYYIQGGPQQVTRAIMPVIEKAGGRCLANATVKEILFNDNGRAIGVLVERANKEYKFYAKKGVISAAGFTNTFKKLAPIDKIPNVPKSYKHSVTRTLNELSPGAQHFQIFVGFNKTSKELGFPSHNRWVLRLPDKDIESKAYDYDTFLQEFHKDPINGPLMGFVSFPSAKDPDYIEHYGDNKASCVIVSEIPRYHFEKYSNQPCGGREKEYENLKKQIGDKLIEELVYKIYPKSRESVVKIKYGTALSAEYYLGSMYGESYGLEHSNKRYFDLEISRSLSPKTSIPGLWLAGQDCLSAGWAGAFHGGMLCAELILGYFKLDVVVSGRTLIKDLEKLDGVYTK